MRGAGGGVDDFPLCVLISIWCYMGREIRAWTGASVECYCRFVSSFVRLFVCLFYIELNGHKLCNFTIYQETLWHFNSQGKGCNSKPVLI